MTGKRKRYSAEFKAKVAMAALRGELTISPLTTKGIHLVLSRETDILWAPEFEYPVQCFGGNADFGRPVPIGAGS